MSNFRVDLSGLRKFRKQFTDPAVFKILDDLPKRAVPLVAQAIADNFTKEGPGWAPLSRITLGQVKPKRFRKKKGWNRIKQMVMGNTQPARRILRKSSLLFNSVTKPGAAHNIMRTQGTRLIWGTDLVYASIHQHGGVITAKGGKKLFVPMSPKGVARGGKLTYGTDFILLNKVTIPARPYLHITAFWQKQLEQFLMEDVARRITEHYRRAA